MDNTRTQAKSSRNILPFLPAVPCSAKSPCLVSCDLSWHCGITSPETGAQGRWCFLLQAGIGAPARLRYIPFPSQAAPVDPPLPRSARGGHLPATHRAKRAFGHQPLPRGWQAVLSAALRRQAGTQHPTWCLHVGGNGCGSRSPGGAALPQLRAPRVPLGARLRMYSQWADVHRIIES